MTESAPVPDAPKGTARWRVGWVAGYQAALDDAVAARGGMERTVEADLARLRDPGVGMRGSLAQSALVLARAIDAYGGQVTSAQQLSAIAKAIQELRSTLARLMEGDDGDRDDAAADAAEQSTPVWGGAPVRDAAQPGAADAGAAVRGGGPAAA